MAVPIKGQFASAYTRQRVPYVGAGVWGTGYNPVHAYYGSPPDRQAAIAYREGETTPPFEGVSEELVPEEFWGYTPEDYQGNQDFVRDDRPGWDVEPSENPSRYSTDNQPPVNAPGAAKNYFRSIMGGAYSRWRGKLPRADYMIPTETVSEGWINKPQGRPANAKPSDPSQYERQTSMQQRYRARNNDLAILRSTDVPRAHINSRVTGVKLKVYSQGQRLYDMFPKQQSSDYERPFYYRTAGTGLQDQMESNAMWDISAVERTPPPDPFMGPQDTSLGGPAEYGYTGEDQFYA